MLRIATILVPLVLAAGAVPLAVSCGDEDSSAEESIGATTGLLVSISEERLVVAPADNAPEEVFAVRQVERQHMDFLHLRQHAAQRLPVTVHWTTVDGIRYAQRVDDA